MTAFTLLELLASIGIVATLAALIYATIGQVKTVMQGAYCSNSLRQLGIATAQYLNDHNQVCFAYSAPAPGGTLWYFAYETNASKGEPEGDREVDETQAPIYPYINQVGGVEICPSFPYYTKLSVWKPKYQGASWGYGFNASLSAKNLLVSPPAPPGEPPVAPALSHPANIMLFGDCAQVNTFQAPASPSHPMLEEFYEFDPADKTTHFRHGGCANILFLDGHVEKFTMVPGTLDTRLPGVNIGRFTPAGSTQYLQ
jgi:prepilin-type processing-associated H-X9-DG protein